VNEVVEPLHAPNDGVTTIVATTGDEPVFTAVNAEMFPEPVAGNPIDGASLVHE
jgi:hypothetical protein